jgi:large subunit ribosomal protein L22
MEVKAKLSFIRIATRKVNILAAEVRGKKLPEALIYLRLSPRKKIALTISKLLKSAAANAEQKGTIDVDTLIVKQIIVGKGPTLKRFTPRAKGSASPINKRTSHVSVTLAEK